MPYEVHPRKTHDLAHPVPVSRSVAVSLAFTAGRFGVLAAQTQFGYPVFKESGTFGTEDHLGKL